MSHALHIASLGLRVLGLDVAETAVSIAQKKAAGRGLDAEFVVADALDLHRLDRVFETVLDCGLFHTFDSDEQGAPAWLATIERSWSTRPA
jgi:2-polyprenyl-3-methyl-5-hydroxy-6-metoxy-1,4-benzoquinol methylase